MKIKSQVAIAGLLFAGLMTTGCQQMGAQQSTGQQVSDTPKVVEPVTPVAPPVVQQPPVRQTPPAVPPVKAKGNYKGPVKMDPASQGAMQQYQQK